MMRKALALLACAMMAPAMASAQTGGLTHVQLLALQQQLKEECGLAHVTGRMDGPTRHAIAVCSKKYGTHGSGAELLKAMNIGYSGDMSSSGMGTVMGSSGMPHEGRSAESSAPAPKKKARPRRSRDDRATMAAQTDSLMRADRDAHGYNQGKKPTKRDTAYSAVADSLARATKGLPAGPTKTKKK